MFFSSTRFTATAGRFTGADQLPAIVILDRGGAISGAPIAGFDPDRKLVDVLSDRIGKLRKAK